MLYVTLAQNIQNTVNKFLIQSLSFLAANTFIYFMSIHDISYVF